MVGSAAMMAVLLAPTASIARHDDHSTAAPPWHVRRCACAYLARAGIWPDWCAADRSIPYSLFNSLRSLEKSRLIDSGRNSNRRGAIMTGVAGLALTRKKNARLGWGGGRGQSLGG